MRRLQCALLATAAVIGFASIASAADMPVKARPMAPAIYNWTGFYAGLQAGYGWQDPTYTYTVIPESTPFKAKGFVGGGTLGYNWQAGMWVLGAEVDLSFADVKGSINTFGAAVPTTPCLIAGEGCTAELSWFGTGRARLGYAMGDFLPYITGGAAVGHVIRERLISAPAVLLPPAALIRHVGAGLGAADWNIASLATGRQSLNTFT